MFSNDVGYFLLAVSAFLACTSSGVRHEVTDEYPYADNYEARDDVTMTYTVEVEMVGPEADRKAIYNAYAVFECEIEHEGNEDIFLQFGFIGESYKMEAIYQGNDNVASDDIISMLGMTKEVVINTYTTKMTVTIATLEDKPYLRGQFICQATTEDFKVVAAKAYTMDIALPVENIKLSTETIYGSPMQITDVPLYIHQNTIREEFDIILTVSTYDNTKRPELVVDIDGIMISSLFNLISEEEKYIMNKDAKVKVVLKEYSYKVTSEQINNEDLLTGYNMQIKASTYELIEPKYMTVTLNITGGNPKIDCPETIDYTEDDSIITLSCNVIGNPKPNIIGFTVGESVADTNVYNQFGHTFVAEAVVSTDKLYDGQTITFSVDGVIQMINAHIIVNKQKRKTTTTTTTTTTTVAPAYEVKETENNSNVATVSVVTIVSLLSLLSVL